MATRKPCQNLKKGVLLNMSLQGSCPRERFKTAIGSLEPTCAVVAGSVFIQYCLYVRLHNICRRSARNLHLMGSETDCAVREELKNWRRERDSNPRYRY